MSGTSLQNRRMLVKLARAFARGLFEAVPANCPLLYRACRAYVDRFNGDNNDDIKANGEKCTLRRVLPGCKVVFDVGANVGQWTKLALSVNPAIQVHCFEPGAGAFTELARSSFPSNVVLNNFGLGSTKSEVLLYTVGEAAGTNSLYQRHGVEEFDSVVHATETVRLDTLDSYCHTHNIHQVDFLKIDVEGHELQVLRGAHEMLVGGAIRFIQFEYGGCYIDARVFLRDVFDSLAGLDYDFYKILPTRLRLIERYSQRLETFQYSNWLLVHKRKGIVPDVYG